jgi:hypothetical protein
MQGTASSMRTSPAGAPLIPGSMAPQTSGRKVAGWLIVCFAVLPLAMGVKGEGAGYFVAGAAMVVVGGALIVSAALKNRS